MNRFANCCTCRVVAAVLVGLLAAPPAWAAGASPGRTPTLAVAAFAVDDAAAPVAARLSYLAEQAARATVGRYDVKEIARLLDPAGTAARQDKAQEGKTAYDAARKLYDDLDVQKAAESCDKSLQAYEKSDLSATFDELITAWTLRVASLIASGEAKGAAIELNLLLPMGDRAVFDPNAFPPDFIAQVKQKRDDLKAKSNLSLEVTAKPVPARVFLDGVWRGATPVEIKNLSPGDHFLTLVAPGYQILQKRVRAGPGAVENAQLEMAAKIASYDFKIDALRRNLRTKDRNTSAKVLTQELGVDQVLAVAASSAGKEVRVLAARVSSEGKQLSFLEESLPADPAKFDDAARALLSKVVGGEVKGGSGGGGGSRAAGGDGSFQWTMRHTGFLLMGLGVGAAGAGVGCGLEAKFTAEDFRNKMDAPQVNKLWAEREQTGRTYAAAADLSFLGAILLAGTGLVLALVGGGDDAAPPPARPTPTVPIPAEKPKRAEPEKKPVDEKKAAEDKKAEERRAAEEKKEADRKKAEDDKRAADEKKEADRKKAEDDKRAADEKKETEKKSAGDVKKSAAEEKKEAERKKAEEKKAAAEAKKEEARKKAEEKKEAERKRLEEKKEAERKKAEERKAAAEEKKEAERKKAEEKKAAAEEKKKASEDKRAADEKQKADDEKAAEDKRKADEEKSAEEKKKADEAEARKEDEKRKADEAKKKKEEEQKKKAPEKKLDEKKIEDFDDLRDDR